MQKTAVIKLILAVSVICLSCASYKKQYSKQARNWLQDTVSVSDELTHTMYLVGDAGNDAPDKPSPVLAYLKKVLPEETANSSIVFLGDNIYEYGMPPKEDSADREVAEYRIGSQLQALDSFKGRPVFVPGNHDWRGWGLKGLSREAKYIQTYLNGRNGKTNKDDWENYFLPTDGCSGAEVVELNEDVVLLVVDSEWWLRNWDKEPSINEDCEIKNRETFKFYFEITLRKYRNKQVVVAMHHPMVTYGSHGGHFTAKQHLFPLTDLNEKMYVPLPVIGTLGVAYRSAIGSRQDVANQHYQELKKGIMAAAKKNGNFIFAAGHEHALQYIEEDNQSFIVSGSGGKKSGLVLGKGSQFAAGVPGYSTVSFYKNGDMLIRFWEVNAGGDSAHLVFQKKVEKKKLTATELPSDAFSVYEKHEDSLIKPLTIEEVKPVGGFHKLLLGEHHRDIYIEKYPLPSLDLATFKGGVTPTKLGGGNQTNSLRVKDTEGRDYVLRGLDKDVTRFLPFPFNRITTARYLVKDNFLSTHPFAPLAIPHLAEAINVYHTNPTIYYVPMQPDLNIYNPVFGNKASLVEERPAGKKWQEAAFFGNPEKIMGTMDVLEEMFDENKYKVDQAWALRTRMLDILVGDWDRHDDQWAWAFVKQDDGGYIYRPIPRDRDQAFSKYDGFATTLVRYTMPFMRQLQVYGPTIYNTKWNTWSARLFDRCFLTELTWPQWEEQVNYIQQHLTDSAIENAFNSWPQKARELSAAHIINSIKARRADLMTLARKHYEFINESVNITGSDERERIVLTRDDDEHTTVTVYQISKNDEIKRTTFQRQFENSITKTINIYGMGNADDFIVTGDVDKGIKIRLIGGQGKDTFIDSSNVRMGSRKTLVYDDLRTNTIEGGKETRDLRTSLYRYNVYDRRDAASNYNITMLTPIIGANPDDGFLIGASVNLVRYGFKKEPFKSQQIFGGGFATGTKAFRVNYTGDFINALGKADFYLDAYYKGPTFAFNYAGIGNETKRPIDDANYYRVRQGEIAIYPAVKKRMGINGFTALGPLFMSNEIQATDNRYLTDSLNSKDPTFKRKNYAGARLLFDFNSLDNLSAPHSGIKFKTSLNYLENLDSSANFLAWRATFSFYKSLDNKENLVLASQVGAGVNFGDGAEFFQMPTIGGDQGLRAYRTERFYGKSSFWQSTDLRLRFGTSYNQALPFTAGMYGGFDYGRVWENSMPSKKWHYDYGGGIWVAPVDLLTFSVGVFFPGDKDEESPRVTFKMGFNF
jgi:hypothetical protein